jgi:glycosyltransferase involved in cell wall biosynthesis
MFSVVTPTLNALEPLKRCVGSLRGQTDVALEHIVEDGASVDGTQEWLAKQKDIKWSSGVDDGMYSAIAKGWKRSVGSMVSWLNADEQYLPGTLGLVQRTFEKNPKIDVVMGNAIIIDEDGSAVAARREVPLRAIYIRNSFLNVYSCTMFFRRELWERGWLRFDPGLRYAADMELILSLLKKNCRFLHLKEYLSLFGIDGTNLSIHKKMKEETTRIKKKYGGGREKIFEMGLLAMRRAERLVRGGYRRVNLEYRVAMDEIPNYRLIRCLKVGGRYTISPRSIR